MENEKPIRDAKGKFLKGHKCLNDHHVKEGEIRQVNSLFPWRDSKGRFLPGSIVPPNSPAPEQVYELKKALVNAVHPKQIRKTIQKLWMMTVSDEYTPEINLSAMTLFFDRVLGKPPKEIFSTSTSHVQTANVNLDLSRVSDDDLRTMQTILEKTQPDQIAYDVAN